MSLMKYDCCFYKKRRRRRRRLCDNRDRDCSDALRNQELSRAANNAREKEKARLNCTLDLLQTAKLCCCFLPLDFVLCFSSAKKLKQYMSSICLIDRFIVMGKIFLFNFMVLQLREQSRKQSNSEEKIITTALELLIIDLGFVFFI